MVHLYKQLKEIANHYEKLAIAVKSMSDNGGVSTSDIENKLKKVVDDSTDLTFSIMEEGNRLLNK